MSLNDVRLSTGRVVTMRRAIDDTVHAEMMDGGEMSNAEWEEYCSLMAHGEIES